mmetsp:Transcript_44580/g.83254  ORF Transcript_44580/g.83254 Transcript_44580/m.83254 type:complete len:243 (+) Transcript_44580:570-1298(+)
MRLANSPATPLARISGAALLPRPFRQRPSHPAGCLPPEAESPLGLPALRSSPSSNPVDACRQASARRDIHPASSLHEPWPSVTSPEGAHHGLAGLRLQLLLPRSRHFPPLPFPPAYCLLKIPFPLLQWHHGISRSFAQLASWLGFFQWQSRSCSCDQASPSSSPWHTCSRPAPVAACRTFLEHPGMKSSTNHLCPGSAVAQYALSRHLVKICSIPSCACSPLTPYRRQERSSEAQHLVLKSS